MAVLMEFLKAKISKAFPGYQEDVPFTGTVHKIDTTGSDDKPFKIHYDDGDKEWVTLAELASILVEPALKARAELFLIQGVPTDGALGVAGPAPSGSKKRSQPTSTPAAAAAPASAAAAGGSKKPRSSSAAAAATAAATPVAEPAAARKPAKTKQQHQAAVQAAAVALSGGAKPARKSAAAAAAGHDSAAVGPTEFDGLVRDVCQAAPKQSEKLFEDSRIMRSVYKGAGAASLPKMAQAVIMGNEAAFTIYGSARATGASASLSPAGHVPVDYKTETQDALKKLQEQIEAVRVADVHKRMLTRVRVYLRDIEAGLPGFKQAWDAWIDSNSLPVLTILEGSGPSRASNVVLEANLYMGPQPQC